MNSLENRTKKLPRSPSVLEGIPMKEIFASGKKNIQKILLPEYELLSCISRYRKSLLKILFLTGGIGIPTLSYGEGPDDYTLDSTINPTSSSIPEKIELDLDYPKTLGFDMECSKVYKWTGIIGEKNSKTFIECVNTDGKIEYIHTYTTNDDINPPTLVTSSESPKASNLEISGGSDGLSFDFKTELGECGEFNLSGNLREDLKRLTAIHRGSLTLGKQIGDICVKRGISIIEKDLVSGEIIFPDVKQLSLGLGLGKKLDKKTYVEFFVVMHEILGKLSSQGIVVDIDTVKTIGSELVRKFELKEFGNLYLSFAVQESFAHGERDGSLSVSIEYNPTKYLQFSSTCDTNGSREEDKYIGLQGNWRFGVGQPIEFYYGLSVGANFGRNCNAEIRIATNIGKKPIESREYFEGSVGTESLEVQRTFPRLVDTLVTGAIEKRDTSQVTQDITPDPFSFGDLTNQALSTLITSNPITTSGINAPSSISITGGQYSINGGSFTSDNGVVSNGDTIRVRLTSSSSNSTTTSSVLTIGGVSDSFDVTTLAVQTDTTPDPFSFGDLTNQALSRLITSNPITTSGINAPSSISITGGQYSINGGSFTSDNGVVSNGDTIRVRLTSSSSNSTTTSSVLTIGGVSDSFDVTTQADTQPPSISFFNITLAAANSSFRESTITANENLSSAILRFVRPPGTINAGGNINTSINGNVITISGTTPAGVLGIVGTITDRAGNSFTIPFGSSGLGIFNLQ